MQMEDRRYLFGWSETISVKTDETAKMALKEKATRSVLHPDYKASGVADGDMVRYPNWADRQISGQRPVTAGVPQRIESATKKGCGQTILTVLDMDLMERIPGFRKQADLVAEVAQRVDNLLPYVPDLEHNMRSRVNHSSRFDGSRSLAMNLSEGQGHGIGQPATHPRETEQGREARRALLEVVGACCATDHGRERSSHLRNRQARCHCASSWRDERRI